MGGRARKSERNGGLSPLFHFLVPPPPLPHFRPSTVTPATQARGGVTPYNGLYGEAVEASNVINVPKCNKGPKCNNFRR